VTLDQLPVGHAGVILRVGGEPGFRRRLLELGLLPGTELRVLRVAPLGDPLELWCRGAHLSIRQREAQRLEIDLATEQTP
jgi:ferrous iron transport protein A